MALIQETADVFRIKNPLIAKGDYTVEVLSNGTFTNNTKQGIGSYYNDTPYSTVNFHYNTDKTVIAMSAGQLPNANPTPTITQGVATLVGGFVSVPCDVTPADGGIFLTSNGGDITNLGYPYIKARVEGASFDIQSLNSLDTSDVAWVVIN